jgi:thiamine-phosphate diphosphorylase
MDPVSERNGVLQQLEKATALLGQSMNPGLVSPSGAQIGYAIRGARDKDGIAAIPGRITGSGDRVAIGGPCSFGPDEEIARAILTLMKFDPRRRSAALLRCSDRVLAVLEDDLFLECASYNAATARQSISTMDWGIASCCTKGVPDVIYPRGGRPEHAAIVLCGEDPVDVANNIIICSNRM